MTPLPFSELVDFHLIAPELFLAAGAMLLLVFGAFAQNLATARVTGMSAAILVIAGIYLLVDGNSGETLGGAFILDDFARCLKILALTGATFTLVMGRAFLRFENFERYEFSILIVIATLGMMLMISANDIIALYMGLELQSLAIYVLAAIHRDNLRATEAGVKYFVLGALSSGMLLYGMSIIYGMTGQTGFGGIREALSEDNGGLAVVVGLVFMLAGTAFKLSAVPFHMWTPDVYEGAPTPVTAYLAAATKIAAVGMITRIIFSAFEPTADTWQQIVIFMAIASMLLGSFAAIVQRNIKRLMAYSSIAHMGYLLAGLAAGTQIGVRGVVIYLCAYLAMTLGTFACILAMRRKNGMVEAIDDLAGLWQTRPVMAVLLAILMWSLAGIPPFFGFFAKWYVFMAVVEAELYALAVIGALSFVVGAYYYLRIVKLMFFDEPTDQFVSAPGELKLVLGLSSAVTVFFIFYPGPIFAIADAASASLFPS